MWKRGELGASVPTGTTPPGHSLESTAGLLPLVHTPALEEASCGHTTSTKGLKT